MSVQENYFFIAIALLRTALQTRPNISAKTTFANELGHAAHSLTQVKVMQNCKASLFCEVKRCGCHGRPICEANLFCRSETLRLSRSPNLSYFCFLFCRAPIFFSACSSLQPRSVHPHPASPARAFAICCGVTFTCNSDFVWGGPPASSSSKL